MIAKMKKSANCGTKTFPNVSAGPTSAAPTCAPPRVPSPPTTTTMSESTSASTSIPGWRPRTGAATTPASPASAAPVAYVTAKRRSVSTPSAESICASSTPARMSAPARDRRWRAASDRASVTPKAMTKSR